MEYLFIREEPANLVSSRHQGQFFPFFILTLTGLVTLPLTYNLLKPSKGKLTRALVNTGILKSMRRIQSSKTPLPA
jgi:preprotein translocase subunit Sec63